MDGPYIPLPEDISLIGWQNGKCATHIAECKSSTATKCVQAKCATILYNHVHKMRHGKVQRHAA